MTGIEPQQESQTKVLILSTYEAYLQPLTAAKLSTQLKTYGCEVDVIDCFVQSIDIEIIKNHRNFAISMPLSDSVKSAMKLLKAIVKYRPDAKVAFFGAHATLNRELLVTEYGIDVPDDLVKYFTGKVSQIDYNILPDRNSLLNFKHYSYPGGLINGKVVANIETTEGCRFKCTHCSVFSLSNGSVKYKDIAIVMDEIAYAVENGAQHISFTDPEFMNNDVHTPNIINEMHSRFPELTFDVITRVDRILRYKDIFISFFDKGCQFVTTAIEFPCDNVLRILRKGYKTADLAELSILIKTTNIKVNPTLITFTPWVDKETILEGEKYLSEIGLTHIIDPVQYSTRLMITKDSHLLTSGCLDNIELRETEFGFDWKHPDEEVDNMHRQRVSKMGGGFNRCCVRC